MKRNLFVAILSALCLCLCMSFGAACNYINWSDDSVSSECLHDWTSVITTKATCDNEGVVTFICSLCEKNYTERIPALGHNQIINEGQEATCTEVGWNAYETCSRCDYSTYSELPVSDHSYSDWEDIINTCTEHKKMRSCTTCKNAECLILEATHSYINGLCDKCGEIEIKENFQYNEAIVSLDWFNAMEATYYIQDEYDFNGIGYLLNEKGIDFKEKIIILQKDLDFSDIKRVIIGKYEDYFYGTFDGTGYNITLKITNENYKPIKTDEISEYYNLLFNAALIYNNKGEIKNLTINSFEMVLDIEVQEVVSNYSTALLVVNNYGIISGCELSGAITCTVGKELFKNNVLISAMFENNYGYINKCFLDCEANIDTKENAGYFYAPYGNYNYGRVEDCVANGNIIYTNHEFNLNNSVAGLINTSNFSESDSEYLNRYDMLKEKYGDMGIYNCNVYTDINSTSYNRDEIGGVVGGSTGPIDGVCYYGNITLESNSQNTRPDVSIGGIVAETGNSIYNNCIISNCSFEGTIKYSLNNAYEESGYYRTADIGGIVSENLRENLVLRNNTFKGNITVENNIEKNDNVLVLFNIGGIIGANLYWLNPELESSLTEISGCKNEGEINIEAPWGGCRIGGIGGNIKFDSEISDKINITKRTFNISNCIFNGKILVSNKINSSVDYVVLGGIIGHVSSISLEDCKSEGSFTLSTESVINYGSLVGDGSYNPFLNERIPTKYINCSANTKVNLNGKDSVCKNLFCAAEFAYIYDENIKKEIENNYHYQTLDENSKGFYQELYTWIAQAGTYHLYEHFMPTLGPIDYGKYNLTADDAVQIGMMVYFDNPEFYYFNTTYYDTYELNGKPVPFISPTVYNRYSSSNIDKENIALENILNEVSNSVVGMSEVEKVTYIYNYIKNNVQYTEMSEYTLSVIGTLLQGEAVCEGYAVSFKYLCDYFDINCIIVASDVMDHAWNIVEIEGEWYNVDVTWADTSNKEYLLLGSKDFNVDHYEVNQYFLLPMISENNYIDT